MVRDRRCGHAGRSAASVAKEQVVDAPRWLVGRIRPAVPRPAHVPCIAQDQGDGGDLVALGCGVEVATHQDGTGLADAPVDRTEEADQLLASVCAHGLVAEVRVHDVERAPRRVQHDVQHHSRLVSAVHQPPDQSGPEGDHVALQHGPAGQQADPVLAAIEVDGPAEYSGHSGQVTQPCQLVDPTGPAGAAVHLLEENHIGVQRIQKRRHPFQARLSRQVGPRADVE